MDLYWMGRLSGANSTFEGSIIYGRLTVLGILLSCGSINACYSKRPRKVGDERRREGSNLNI